MKKKIIFFLSCILLGIPYKTSADEEIPYMQYRPEYMPQAPTSQAIARAIDIPVNPYTGIPNITIPIYTIQIGDISVPITLSYQGGGIRPSQEATCVGLGWVLNAGGAITRTVKCADDFMEYRISDSQYQKGFLEVEEWPSSTTAIDPNYYKIHPRIDNEGAYYYDFYLNTDTEPDLFFYRLPEQCGKFSFKKDKSIVHFDKSQNIQINCPHRTLQSPVFYAIDSKGTGYCFEEKEKTQAFSGLGLYNINTTIGGYDLVHNSGAFGDTRIQEVANYTSAWFLTRMISPTNDTIDFEYEDESYHLPLQESCRYQKRIAGAYGFDSGETDGAKYYISKANVESKRLSRIIWRGGYVEFGYKKTREDLYRPTYLSGNPKALTSITVYNQKGKAICCWSMSYGYFNDDIENVEEHRKYLFKRLRLEEVKNVLTEEDAYKFSYYESVPLPVKNTKNLDYWGYYNGINQGNTYYCPASYEINENSNKGAIENNCKIGILESIRHPTKGLTRLHWESNAISNTKKRGGLRIARIEGQKNVSYVYEGGKDIVTPCIYYYEELRGHQWAAACMIQPSESVRPLSTTSNGNFIGYSKVWEIYDDNSKIEYIYHNEKETQQYADLPYFPTLTDWKNGLLLKRVCYDKLGDTISLTSNTYKLKVTTNRYLMGFGEIYAGYLKFYYNTVECPYLVQMINTEYRKHKEYTTKHSYQYNDNLLCTEESTQIGTDVHKRIYKYANDFSDTTSRAMASRNMIAIPVAQWNDRNGTIYDGQRTVYDGFNELTSDGNTAICGPFNGKDSTFSWMQLPKYQLTLNTGYPTNDISNCIYDTTIIHNSYTRYGRVRDLVYKGMPISYVWSYKGMYPIAEFLNATYQQYVENTGDLNIDTVKCFEPDKIMESLDNISNKRSWLWSTGLNIENSAVKINFYEPLVGILDMTDHRGIVFSYSYDKKHRLSSVSKLNTMIQTEELVQDFTYGKDYVSTKTYPARNPIYNIERIQYYDEWGRPSVSASQGRNQNGTYSYTMQTYDFMGRPLRSYLSVPSNNTTGELIDSTNIQELSLAAFSNDHFGYSETSYDVLGRVIETTIPGKAWNEAGKFTTIQYLTNAANEVKKYTVSGNTLNEAGYYDTGTLDCTMTTDPDGFTVKNYKDLFGNVVLERRAENFDTYYVYDDYNRLRFVLPPKYQEEKNIGYYAYQYEYDGRGRIIKKTLPGCEPIRYWYDNADRLIKMQDGVLANTGSYRIWTYDALGRQLTQRIEKNGVVQYYETKNFYDDYDFVEDYSEYFPTITDNLLPNLYYYGQKGCLTGSWQRTTDEKGILTVLGYDDLGYISKKTVSALDRFIMISDYENNLAGKITEERFCEYIYKVSTGSMEKTISGIMENKYNDLHTNLLTSSVLSLIDDEENILRTDTINHFTYDDFGRIKRNNRGGSKADITYEYNQMHGWVNRIKSSCGFEQRLYRETEGNIPRWNGGISAMTWKTSNTYLRRFDYDYDSMNRLTSAEYSQYEITGGSSLSPTLSLLPTGMENEDYTSEYFYDKNSNLLWAYRQGVVDDVESGLYYDTMDDYNAYYRGNQKLSVDGTGVGEPSYYGSSSFVDRADETVEYAYNANGAMTMDLNKGITNIQYDFSGNIKEITLDNNRSIRYVYTTDGTRLRTVHLQKKNGVWLKDSTDYYGNLLLKNGALNKYQFSGGYLSFSGGTANECHYYIKDYQGSNRMVVSQGGTTEQITHYYPYGGVIGGIDRSANLQPYKFEGKELDRTYGLDWYDIHARQYDPIVPAWHTIDPQAEKNYSISPYAYCGGDPVNRVDRDGEIPIATNIIGALLAAGVDYTGQVINNLSKYNSYKHITWKDFTHVDISDILVSAAEGFITSGGSLVRKGITKATISVGTNIFNNAIDVKTSSDGLKKNVNSAREAIINSAMDMVAGEMKMNFKIKPLRQKNVNKGIETVRQSYHSRGEGLPTSKAKQLRTEIRVNNKTVKDINNVISDNTQGAVSSIINELLKWDEDEDEEETKFR